MKTKRRVKVWRRERVIEAMRGVFPVKESAPVRGTAEDYTRNWYLSEAFRVRP